MMPHNVREQITVRALWLRLSDPTISREQARAAAAEAIAQEWREANQDHQRRRLDAASHPVGRQQQQPDVRRSLIAKVMAMIDRLHQPPKRAWARPDLCVQPM
jgi:hypothetical protein